jgi:hypothetical protein
MPFFACSIALIFAAASAAAFAGSRAGPAGLLVSRPDRGLRLRRESEGERGFGERERLSNRDGGAAGSFWSNRDFRGAGAVDVSVISRSSCAILLCKAEMVGRVVLVGYED